MSPPRKLSRAQARALLAANARGLYQLRPRLWWTADNTQRIRNPTVSRLLGRQLLIRRDGRLWPTPMGRRVVLKTFGAPP